MGTLTFSSLQVMAASDKQGMDHIAALATEAGLIHTGVQQLPHNRNWFLFIYPSGSKAFWPEEAIHLTALGRMVKAVDAWNTKKGGAYLQALQTCVQENTAYEPRFRTDHVVAFIGNAKYEEAEE